MTSTNISIPIFDNEGTRIPILLRFDDGAVNTVAEALAAYQAAVPLLFGGARIVKGGLSTDGATVQFNLPNTSPAWDAYTVPEAGARIQAGATLSFNNANGVADSIFIPGFGNAFMSAGVVNTADPDVAALILALSAGGLATHRVTDRNGIELTQYVKGKKSVRKA